MNDIAICGKDIRFCRMLELELQTLGYTVIHNPRNGRFRLWIIDLDTMSMNNTERLYLGYTRESAALSAEIRTKCQVILQRPFSMREIRQEVIRLLSPEQTAISVSPTPAILQRTPHGFELDGEPLSLTDTEELVLQVLYDRRGEVISREELSEILGNETNAKLADVYICLLRKKLECNNNPRILFTVRGVGYRLAVENS